MQGGWVQDRRAGLTALGLTHPLQRGIQLQPLNLSSSSIPNTRHMEKTEKKRSRK